MVNLKVLSAITNAKRTAITEDVYNVICREADTKYRYNIETIVKAMLLSMRDDDINSDKVQDARNILLSILTGTEKNAITVRAYECYFVSNMTVEDTAREITELWDCLYPYTRSNTKNGDNAFIVNVANTILNAPGDVVKRMNKQYYRKALCIAWADTYMNNTDPDPAEEWKRRYWYTFDTSTGQLVYSTQQ